MALVAYQHLTPGAQQAVDALLGNTQTIDEIATLPDDWRNGPPETKPWHFVDIPVSSTQIPWAAV